MAKSITVDCPECGNQSNVTPKCKEPVQYCPLCGAAVLVAVSDDDDDDYDPDDR